MSEPLDLHATKAIDELLPRFPKRWHKQLRRLGLDSFAEFIKAADGREILYTIKSGNAVLMARCVWDRRASTLLCNMEIIHTRGSTAVPLDA